MRDSRTVVNGLSFYVPGTRKSETLTAYERAAASGQEIPVGIIPPQDDGMYLFVPGGECELELLDVGPLLGIEHDLKRVRAQQ